MADKLLTVQEACEYLRVSRATFYRLAKDGTVVLRKVRGRTVVREAALARTPLPAARGRRGAARKRQQDPLVAWIDELIGAGLVSPHDRRKVLHPYRERYRPANVDGVPLSELIIRERRSGW